MAANHHGIGTTVPDADGQYSADHIDTFQSEDRSAARAVILLMSAVFTIGLTGASIVSWTCFWH